MRRVLPCLVALAFAAPALAGEVPKPVEREGGGYNPVPPAHGFRYPDCFCTDSQGKRVEMGQKSCLQIGSQQVMAQCDMSLNSPTWRRLEEACPNV